jgi:hypothetical protein
LTGVPAGAADAHGLFPAGTVNAAVETRVQELLQLRSRYGAESKSDGRPSPLPE